LWHHQQLRGQPFKNTVVRMPGPSWVENRMTLKTCPVVGETSNGPERALPPEDPTVTVKDFMYRPPGIRAPAILNPTPRRWLEFQADPARRAHRRGRVAGAGRIFELCRVVDRF
jgi:hypothetical protein